MVLARVQGLLLAVEVTQRLALELVRLVVARQEQLGEQRLRVPVHQKQMYWALQGPNCHRVRRERFVRRLRYQLET